MKWKSNLLFSEYWYKYRCFSYKDFIRLHIRPLSVCKLFLLIVRLSAVTSRRNVTNMENIPSYSKKTSFLFIYSVQILFGQPYSGPWVVIKIHKESYESNRVRYDTGLWDEMNQEDVFFRLQIYKGSGACSVTLK